MINSQEIVCKCRLCVQWQCNFDLRDLSIILLYLHFSLFEKNGFDVSYVLQSSWAKQAILTDVVHTVEPLLSKATAYLEILIDLSIILTIFLKKCVVTER